MPPVSEETVHASGIDASSVEKLRETLISDLSVTDGMLASNLMQTMDWKLEGDEVSAVTENKFEHMQIMQSAAKLQTVFHRHTEGAFRSRFCTVKKACRIPWENFLKKSRMRDVFKGSIIGGA